MTAKYDIETYLYELEEVVKNNLTAKLAEIDTEKGDGIELKTVDDNAYIVQNMDEKALSYDPAIFIWISNLQSIENYGDSAQTVTAEIDVIISNDLEGDIDKRLWRYQRALREIIETNFYKISRTRQKVQVTSLTPVSLATINDDRLFKAIGIEVEATF